MAELNRKVNKKKWFPKRAEALKEQNKVALIKPKGIFKEEPITYKGPTHHTKDKVLKFVMKTPKFFVQLNQRCGWLKDDIERCTGFTLDF